MRLWKVFWLGLGAILLMGGLVYLGVKVALRRLTSY